MYLASTWALPWACATRLPSLGASGSCQAVLWFPAAVAGDGSLDALQPFGDLRDLAADRFACQRGRPGDH